MNIAILVMNPVSNQQRTVRHQQLMYRIYQAQTFITAALPTFLKKY